MKMKTEVFSKGWGLKVGGARPYLAQVLEWHKVDVPCTESYHSPVRVVLVPLAEYRRLLKGARG